MIPISKIDIHIHEVWGVDAVDLYNALEPTIEYEQWLPMVIENNGFAFELDYTQLEIDFNPKSETWFTLEASKIIAMGEMSQKGRDLRSYILLFEKRRK